LTKARLSADAIKAQASALGFDLCGIAPAGEFPELSFLREWLDRGHAGEMAWMRRTAGRRADVRNVVPGARSVIVTATIYNVDRRYSTEVAERGTARISRYAWGDDYHDVLAARLARLLNWMREASSEPFDARAYVDTGPVQERVYAQYAGLGWIGKNTCLINERVGSWLFLSEIICTLPLEPDAPALDRCGTCTLCIEACPTGAITEPHVLDATRCVSYLTIELRGDIPDAHRAAMRTHTYGCDICQDVCPYNHQPAVSHDPSWQPRPGLDAPPLLELWKRSDDELGRLIAGSAMTRATLRGLRRNLAVAMSNAGVPPDALEPPREDQPSAADPMVRRHIQKSPFAIR
jgi:epoxyqueuosine reductase